MPILTCIDIIIMYFKYKYIYICHVKINLTEIKEKGKKTSEYIGTTVGGGRGG